MHSINIHEAKTQFSKLVDAAVHGKEIIIAKAGVPIARLGPLVATPPKRVFGVLKNKIKIAKDFDAPLSDDILTTFEGE